MSLQAEWCAKVVSNADADAGIKAPAVDLKTFALALAPCSQRAPLGPGYRGLEQDLCLPQASCAGMLRPLVRSEISTWRGILSSEE
ncbi:uncharacterized protein PHACADRAFT_266549 [Phanerochaete carnosa HHB-10118-sp]|uniref:Uncharacterized protein n=1 Tax=Phanerochaete carnosa (strain HHB-10118-sp) TaxID=650164 RepID=K5UF69_PHACS|nr:uncharacterized protein PHACADRAFT_266549 [Phanerochaete carnosa HHB-10118-sp]EKM48096.1 hypothetical protein PHACADRAFT_266549 [Phanerochaete carnosa HHB-10118-sp]